MSLNLPTLPSHRRLALNLRAALSCGVLLLFLVPLRPASAQPDVAPTAEPAAAIDQAALTAYEAAAALQQQQLFDLAAKEWQAMLRKYPQGTLGRRARHNLAVCRFHQQQLKEAEADFAEVVRLAEDKALLESALANLGLTRFNLATDPAVSAADQRAWYEKSITIFDRLLADFPKSTHATSSRFYRAEAFGMLNQHAEAASAYKAVLADTKARAFYPDARFGRSLSLIALGEAERALPLLSKLVDYIGTDRTLRSRAYEQRGLGLLQLERFNEAAEDFQAATNLVEAEQVSIRAELHSQAGFALYRAKDYAAAAVDYSKAAKLDTQANGSQPTTESMQAAQSAAQLAAGKCWLLAGDQAQAIAQLQPLWEANPVVRNAEAAYWLAQAELSTDASRAITTAEQALRTMPADPLAADLELLYGKALLQASSLQPTQQQKTLQIEKACSVLTTLFERSPSTKTGQQAAYLASRSLLQTGQTERASSLINQLLSKAEKAPPEWHQLAAEAAIGQADWQRAAEHYQQLLAKFQAHPSAPKWRLRMAETLIASEVSGKATQDEAARLLEQSIAGLEGKDQTRARLELARVKLKQQAPEVALKSLALIPESNQLAGEAAYLKGLALQAMDKSPEAAIAFQQTIDAQGGFSENALYELAWLKQADVPAEAMVLFESLIKNYPQSSLVGEAWYRIAESQYEANDFPQAAQSFRSAAEATIASGSDPVLQEQSLHFCGWAWLEAKEHDKALAAFEEQLAANANGKLAGDARWLIGECQYKARRYAQALQAYNAAQSANNATNNAASDNQLDLTSLASLHAGQAAAQLDNWQQSLVWLERAEGLLKQVTPESKQLPFSVAARLEEVTYERAWALNNLGQRDEARPLFEKLSKQATDQVLAARATFMVGELQFADKAFAEAVRTFFKVAYGYGGREAPERFHGWQAESLFEAARCLEQLGRPGPAKKLYIELIERFPESEKAQLARDKLAPTKA